MASTEITLPEKLTKPPKSNITPIPNSQFQFSSPKMDKPVEEFEPLFDYSRVQPPNLSYLQEEDIDSSPIFFPAKQKRRRRNKAWEDFEREEKVVVLDDDDGGGEVEEEENWLASPPRKVADVRLEEDETLRVLRLKKQELASLASSAEDILRTVTAPTTKKDSSNLEDSDIKLKEELPPKKVDRKKVVISFQDKGGQKQFRVYTDEKFERLFKMYADKVNHGMESLVFSFDGDKISPTATPEGLGLEDDDMIEVHLKSK